MKKYANFLKQPLKLEMFVPCDDEGNPLDFPKEQIEIRKGQYRRNECYMSELIIYKKAQEKLLFKGFTYTRWYKGSHIIILIHNGQEIFNYNASQERFIISANKIEHLVKYNLELTENAIKQL